MKLPSNLSSFFYHFLKNYRLKIFGYTVATLIWSIIQIYIRPQLVRVILNNISITPSSQIMSVLFIPFILYSLMIFGRMIISRIQQTILLSITPYLKKNIIRSMMGYVKKHSYQYFQNQPTGTISNRVNDVQQNTIRIIDSFGKEILTPIFSIVFACAAVYAIHPGLMLILISWIISMFFIAKFIYVTSKKYSSELAISVSQTVGHIADILSNILNVKLFSRSNDETKRLDQNLDNIVTTDKKLRQFNVRVSLLTGIATFFMVSGSLGFLIYESSLGHVSVGDFGFLFILNNTIVEMVWHMTIDVHKFSETLGTIQQGLSVITKSHDVVDKPHAKSIKISKGLIEFKNINFAYKGYDPLFNNLNIRIEPGQKIGLVGYSGSGKTSFVNLILRLYDIDSGVIKIDNQNIKDYKQDSLRAQIAMTSQDTMLFNRSIYENIRYGKPNATREQVEDACKKAFLHSFIMSLDKQYQTMVGERGMKLSGGQKQRVTIARSILKNAPILILDEATSALDSLTERYIQKSLDQLMKKRTSIVIAHRLSTLLKMDLILVFDKGRIVQMGTIDELKKQKGVFQKLWKNQMQGFLLDSKEIN